MINFNDEMFKNDHIATRDWEPSLDGVMGPDTNKKRQFILFSKRIIKSETLQTEIKNVSMIVRKEKTQTNSTIFHYNLVSNHNGKFITIGEATATVAKHVEDFDAYISFINQTQKTQKYKQIFGTEILKHLKTQGVLSSAHFLVGRDTTEPFVFPNEEGKI